MHLLFPYGYGMVLIAAGYDFIFIISIFIFFYLHFLFVDGCYWMDAGQYVSGWPVVRECEKAHIVYVTAQI